MSIYLDFLKTANEAGEQCLLWPFKKDKGGYGRHGKRGKAHRTSFEIHVSKIPEKHVVMHICDNPSCVNPFHLRCGTQSENMRDMLVKGRARRSFSHINNSGENHGKSKLTESQVIEIRFRVAQKEINKTEASEIYGVSTQQISDICLFKRWKHLK